MKSSKIAAAVLALVPAFLHAQVEFRIGDRTVQVHGFLSQGFVKTDGNNWLTMNSNNGSGAMTEAGLNMSTQITDKFRVGAQIYDRNLGQLGQYHPDLDWAVADYRVTNWLGFRGGKVKTTLGLYTDTQDLDFLRVFALMPQGVYPLDLRDANIAHTGGDAYGTIPLGHVVGSLSYTAYAGHRSDSRYSGLPYFLQTRGTTERTYGGLQYGGDIRWNTPLKGLMVGVSRLNEDLHGWGLKFGMPNQEKSARPDWTNQFYGQYVWRDLQIDGEYKDYSRDHLVRNFTAEDRAHVHSWYVAGSYRISKRLAFGAYYSHYTITSTDNHLFDTSLPNAHDYDKAISARFDATSQWNIKLEGHFMDGYGFGPYPNGFYPQQNPHGFVPNTRALVFKTGYSF